MWSRSTASPHFVSTCLMLDERLMKVISGQSWEGERITADCSPKHIVKYSDNFLPFRQLFQARHTHTHTQWKSTVRPLEEDMKSQHPLITILLQFILWNVIFLFEVRVFNRGPALSWINIWPWCNLKKKKEGQQNAHCGELIANLKS